MEPGAAQYLRQVGDSDFKDLIRLPDACKSLCSSGATHSGTNARSET